MMRFVIPILLLLPSVSFANPIAEVICVPTTQMKQKMASVGHQRQAYGVRESEQMMEIWTDKRGDWTMIVRYASGTSCIVAMGEAWDLETPRDPA